MYYIYFPYVIIVSILMLVICLKQKKSRWWATIVLLAPITTPYFIIKSEIKQAKKWIFLFIISFMLVCGVEGFLWFKDYKADQFSKLNPVDRTTFLITNTIEIGMSEMNEIMLALDIRNTVASGKTEIINAKILIAKGKALLKKNQKIIKKFTIFATDYKLYFQKSHQTHILQLLNFYKSIHMAKYYSTTYQYLNEFERMLNYVQKHFQQIKSRESHIMKNYDQYFIRYRRGLNSYQQYSDERMKAQKKIVSKYPEIEKYLPARAQTKAVNLFE